MSSTAREAALRFFEQAVGKQNVLTNPDDLKAYGKDWTHVEANPSLVVMPGSTEEVSKVLAYCNEHDLPVVPSGGRTGLAAGATASSGEVVISLGRMNKIECIDLIGPSITVQAGVITQTLQEAARKAGLYFGVDLAAKGSCQIGGNIATNAGGLKLIRYGGTREQVLGLEVVLADGRVLDMNTNLIKNNTGYDLKHLFVGSEGTLGIITRATLRLVPPPRGFELTAMAVESFQDITQILSLCNKEGIRPTAFEFFTRDALEIVLGHNATFKDPFQTPSPFYVLLEFERGPKGAEDQMEPFLALAFESGLIQDAVIATSSSEFQAIWALRENISEAVSTKGWVRKNDISLPIAKLPDFLGGLEAELATVAQDIRMVLFGHIGDGNLHLNYVGDKSQTFAEFSTKARAFEERVFELLARHRGSISAEHGIGLLKKKDLHFSRNPLEIAIMREVKKQLDPKGILNPGKIFDV